MRLKSLSVLFGLATLAAAPASAQTRSETSAGIAYETGAVTVSELRKMRAHRDDYRLWITTAAQGSGAYLSDAALSIEDGTSGKVLLETMVIGPWLMVDLPQGRYVVRARFGEQKQSKSTEIRVGGRHQLIYYFDSSAGVSPDWASPFKASPYASND